MADADRDTSPTPDLDAVGDPSALGSPQVDGPGAASERVLRTIAERAVSRQQPIKLRTALSILNPMTGQYVGWPDQSWKIGATDLAQAQAFRQGVELLFDLFTMRGIEETVKELHRLKTAALD